MFKGERGQGRESASREYLFRAGGFVQVVSRLHPHQRIHLRVKRFLNPQCHIAGNAISPDKSALALSRLDRVGRDTCNATAAAVTVRPTGGIISVRIKLPGWGVLHLHDRFLH
jgi:hypothetical protein